MHKKVFMLILLFSIGNAGIIGSAIGVAKDKAKDKVKETAVDIYKQRKEIRRENEKITGNKSLISKSEDKVEGVKEKITNVKKLGKETVVNSIGKENVEYLQRGKSYAKDTLIGKPIN